MLLVGAEHHNICRKNRTWYSEVQRTENIGCYFDALHLRIIHPLQISTRKKTGIIYFKSP